MDCNITGNQREKWGMPVRRLSLFCFIVSALFMCGCATPTATLKKDDFSVEKYKTVYLRTPDSEEGDPRKIYPEVISRLQKLGFDVVSFNKKKPLAGSQGSGFVINSDGYILTSAHIFSGEEKATVWIKGNRHEASVVKTDKEKDIALLKIISPVATKFKTLVIDKSSEYKMGQEVYTIGFPLSDILGNSPRLNRGLISSTVGMKDNPDHLQVSVEIQNGNSGSPLLNSSGHVIGLMQSTLNPLHILNRTGGNLPQNVNFALKARNIKEFVDRANIHFDQVPGGEQTKKDFETVSESIAQVRSGIVTEDQLKQSKLLCLLTYRSFWDIWYRFRVFHIEFYDFDSGEIVLHAGQYRDNMASSESTVLDRTFEQIREKFFRNSKPSNER